MSINLPCPDSNSTPSQYTTISTTNVPSASWQTITTSMGDISGGTVLVKVDPTVQIGDKVLLPHGVEGICIQAPDQLGHALVMISFSLEGEKQIKKPKKEKSLPKDRWGKMIKFGKKEKI